MNQARSRDKLIILYTNQKGGLDKSSPYKQINFFSFLY